MSKIVNRTLDFFEAFAAARKPLALTEIMRVLDIPASSCHDVVKALEERGYLYEVRPRGGFYPTARLYNLSKVLVDHDPFLARVEPVLQRLRDQTGESVFLIKAQGTALSYVAVYEAETPLRLSVNAGDRIRAFHATSAGKAFLSSLPEDELDQLLRRLSLKALTSRTITSRAALKKEIRRAQDHGFFINREESVEDALTLSAKFRWFDALYIITVAGAVTRMDRKLDQVTKWTVKAAQELDQPATVD